MRSFPNYLSLEFLILDSKEPIPSSKVLNNGMLNLVQTISTLPFLQNPLGQTTIILPLDACKPNSNKEIGDFVPGSKYIKIISQSSRLFISQFTCSLNFVSFCCIILIFY